MIHALEALRPPAQVLAEARRWAHLDAVARRVRMQLALEVTALGSSAHAPSLAAWLDAQPWPLGDDARDEELAVTVSPELGRLRWASSGSIERFLPVVRDVVAAAQPERAEVELVARAGAQLAPTGVGSWLELSAAGLDGGWSLAGPRSLDAARTIAPPGVANGRLGRWAAEVGADACVQLRRAIGQPLPMTELLIPLPSVEPARQLAQARAAFDHLEVAWVGDAIAEVVVGLDALALRVGLTERGVSRLGLEVPGLDLELALALAARAGLDGDAQLAPFLGALGAGATTWLSVGRDATGLDVELSFAP